MRDSEEAFITFKTTFSKSFKNGMFAIPRRYSNEILPILAYEKECIFSLGDLDASGRFNLEFRFTCDPNAIVPKLSSMKEMMVLYDKIIKNSGDYITIFKNIFGSYKNNDLKGVGMNIGKFISKIFDFYVK